MIELFETIHIFESGFCQIIGADYQNSAYQSDLTSYAALIQNIESLAPQGQTLQPFIQINIFRETRSFYLTSFLNADYHFHVEDMDESILNAFILELKSFS